MFAQKLENNIWKFTVHAATNKRTYMTFLTIFLLTIPNATAQTIGLLTLVAQIAGFLFEIPSGYIADRIGHKRALVFARASMTLSTVFYIFADSIWYFFVAAVLLSLGWAFESGTTSAFMYDTLDGLGKSDHYAQIIGRIKSIGFAIPIAFIILLSILAEESFRVAFVVALVIDLIGLATVLILKSPLGKESSAEYLGPENFWESLKKFMSVGWLPYVIVGILITGIELGATIGFKNPYQEMLGFSITILGVLWAISRLFIAGMLPFNGWIHNRFSFKQFLLLQASVMGIGFIGIGLTKNMWLVALSFIVVTAIHWGLGSAREQYLLAFIQKSNSKATLLSIQALLNKVVIGIVGVLMGLFIIDVNFQNAYLIIGAMFVLLIAGIILFVPHAKTARKI